MNIILMINQNDKENFRLDVFVKKKKWKPTKYNFDSRRGPHPPDMMRKPGRKRKASGKTLVARSNATDDDLTSTLNKRASKKKLNHLTPKFLNLAKK